MLRWLNSIPWLAGGVMLVAVCFTQSAVAGSPRPEHPRPDLRRDAWINLNGTWDFTFDPQDTGLQEKWNEAGSNAFTQKIVVPYPWESRLSGIERKDYIGTAWYRRTITIPAHWGSARIALVFGAVDWETTAWLDGRELGRNEGGYTPFEFDLSGIAKPGQTHTLVLRVVDRTEKSQPTGKQINWYTRTSGIWQTVYLEARGAAFIQQCHIVNDIPTNMDGYRYIRELQGIRMHLVIPGVQSGDVLQVLPAEDPERNIDPGTAAFQTTIDQPVTFSLDGQSSCTVTLPMNNQRLWTPERPNLYFVRLNLVRNGVMLDSIITYFGLREISRQPLRTGNQAPTKYEAVYLNDNPVYLRGALNQSFNPEGIYAWPNEQAIIFDLKKTKEFGLNFLRMHIKIEEPRFLYWADRLGVLLQCDLPCFWEFSETAQRRIETLYDQVVQRDMSHPSIFSWVLFNETWGLREAYDRKDVQEWVRDFYQRAKQVDPTRLIEDNSPCLYDHVATDINSWHFYIYDPAEAKKHIQEVVDKTFEGSEFNFTGGNKQGTQPMMNSEYGGVSAGSGDRDISWCLHYLTEFQRRHEKICGFIYTELQDIEWEHNGLMNYDRTPKIFGYDDFVPLPPNQPPFTVADILGANFVGTDLNPLHACDPGQSLDIPVWIARYDTPGPATIRVFGRLEGWTVTGALLDMDLGYVAVLTDYIGVFNVGTLKLKLPDEPMAGVIGLWSLNQNDQLIGRGFATIHSLKNEGPRHDRIDATHYQRRWRPADMLVSAESSPGLMTVLDGWKISKPGAVKITYQVPIQREVWQGDVQSIAFIAELGARAGKGKVDWPEGAKDSDYPQTELLKRWPTTVNVRMNGVPVDSVYIQDDPADIRGFLSNLTNEHPSSYGYLTRVEATGETLKKIKESAEASSTIKLELEVPEGTPLSGGLSIYGERSGRYPLDPCLEFRTSNPLPQF